MLFKPTQSMSSTKAYRRFPKQIHMLEDGQIVVFSRNSENMSAKYPDLVESIPKVRRLSRPISQLELMSPSLVRQQGCEDFRYRHRGSRIRYQGEETLAIPAADNAKTKRRQNGRYHSQSAYFRIRSSLSEWRGKD